MANVEKTPNVTILTDGSTATTQSASDNSTKLATTAYADTAAGSASVTPRYTETYNFEDIAQYDKATSTGTITTPAGGPLVRFSSGGADGNHARMVAKTGTTAAAADSYWDLNPVLSYVQRNTTNGDYHSWVLNAAMNSSQTPDPSGDIVIEHMGFILVGASNVVATFEASNANGTTSTQTDIKASVNEDANLRCSAVMTSGTNIKFYVDSVILATHTTNLPSGDLSPFRCSMGIEKDSATTAAVHDVSQLTLSADIF